MDSGDSFDETQGLVLPFGRGVASLNVLAHLRPQSTDVIGHFVEARLSFLDFLRRSWNRARRQPAPGPAASPSAPSLPPRDSALERQVAAAVQAFSRRDFDEADRLASVVSPALDEVAGSAETLAMKSSLLAVRGAAAAHRERWDEATSHFRESLDLARRSGRDESIGAALLNLVDGALRRGAPQDADPYLGEAIERTRHSQLGDFLGKVLIEGGIARVRAGDLAGSVRLYDRAVELRPAWPTAYYQRAWSRFLEGDGGGALDDYRECAKRTPVFFTVQREVCALETVARGELSLDVYRTFCAVREEAGTKPRETEEAARRLLERAPRFAPARLLLADALRHQGNALDARREIRSALESDPDPDTASAGLFLDWDLARRSGDEAGAARARDRLLGEFPDHPAARILQSIPAHPDHSVAVRWTWALDGTMHVEASPPTPRP